MTAAGLTGTSVRGIRLVERLGQGGMGDVYLGLDDRLQRRVAVKALRHDWRLDATARARLLREAQVLSQLEHPGICRLYEHVESPEGDFLVLELVPGRPLRALLGQPRPRRESLRLAIEMAEALVAAHALSVVHRDFKPENVMVTPEGHVKVLDFGLAKSGPREAPPAGALRSPAAEASSGMTELGAVLGTPRYMSPEQARGEPVTAASDMYSFGLVLQELFTGRPPLAEALAPAEVRQKVMWGESEPATGLDAGLASLVERLKALAPGERPSAQAALGRLRSVAEAPRRRARRALAAGVALALVVAAGLSTLGFVRARRAQARAEAAERAALRSRAEAEAVNAFLAETFASADPRALGIDVKVVDVLGRAAAGVERSFAGQPAQEAAVRHVLGTAYLALGELGAAGPHLVRALDLRQGLWGEADPRTWATLHALGQMRAGEGRYAEAERLLRRALELRTRGLGGSHPDTLATLAALADLLRVDRQFEEAQALARRGYELRRATLGERHLDTLEARRQVGVMLTDNGRWDEAERELRASYDVARAEHGPAHPQALAGLRSLGVLYSRQERYADSLAAFAQAHEAMRGVLGDDHPTTLRTAGARGLALVQLRRFAEGLVLLSATQAAQERVLGPGHPDTLETLRNVANALDGLGRPAEARRVYLARWERARAARGPEDRVTLETKSVWANVLARSGRVAEAERLYREVLATRQRVFGEDHEATRRTRLYLAALLRQTGRESEARAVDPPPDPAGP